MVEQLANASLGVVLEFVAELDPVVQQLVLLLFVCVVAGQLDGKKVASQFQVELFVVVRQHVALCHNARQPA